MTFSTNMLAPAISLYENAVDFTKTISELSSSDTRNWNIRNQDATEWQLGDKIVGYDEYPVSFSFSVNEHLLLLAKKIFDCASDYATKNLTTIDGFDSCMIRRYASTPGFLELESSDVDNVSRKLTAILFLDDIEQGGQLTFKNFDVSIPPQKGSVVVFPASFAYSFKINKPKELESLVVVSHFV
jgi:hypothetical protein